MTFPNRPLAIVVVLLASLVTTGTAAASALVFQPVNPSFGGSPANGSYLLNEAQAQDTNKPTKHGSGSGGSSGSGGIYANCPDRKLCQFENALQQAILSRLSHEIVSTIVQDGEIQPGTIDTINFVIDAIDLGGGQMQISITSKKTGQTETFVVDQGS